MNISVKIGDILFKNPVTVASGTFGHSERYYDLEEVKRLGAIIPKTVTFLPQTGNPPVRIVETASGMINAIGIENPGIDAFIANKLPALKNIRVPLIISISGKDEEQWVGIIEKLNTQEGITAVELNLSCPNLKNKVLIAQDAQATMQLVKLMKARSRFPIIAKLSPNVTDIAQIAQAAQDGGADAVSLVNTFQAMAIDVKTRKSRIGNITGGLSGPAIRPIAVYMVRRVAAQVKIPIIGMGGIMTAQDALEFLIAGATMVAVGTANFINPRAPLDVLEGIEFFMKENKIDDINEIIGSLKI
jgi:dihydroorotate dehydrogenase (NAD+) catalytic subunit